MHTRLCEYVCVFKLTMHVNTFEHILLVSFLQRRRWFITQRRCAFYSSQCSYSDMKVCRRVKARLILSFAFISVFMIVSFLPSSFVINTNKTETQFQFIFSLLYFINEVMIITLLIQVIDSKSLITLADSKWNKLICHEMEK